MKTLVYSIFVVVFLISCSSAPIVPEEIVNLEKEIKKSPSSKVFIELNNKYKEYLKNEQLTGDKRERVLERAYKLFLENGKGAYALEYLTELIRDFPDDRSQPRIKDLIKIYGRKGDTKATELLKRLYQKVYPEDKEAKGNYGIQTGNVDEDFKKFIIEKGEKISADLEKNGKLNIKAAKDYIDDCVAFALIAPKDSLSPEYLFNAGEVAHTIKSYDRTFELYEWIINKYPDSPKTPTALFLKGYILDDELKRYDDAKKIYLEFLQKYPNSDLVDDVNTLIEYMGKSDEEILQMIESKEQKK